MVGGRRRRPGLPRRQVNGKLVLTLADVGRGLHSNRRGPQPVSAGGRLSEDHPCACCLWSGGKGVHPQHRRSRRRSPSSQGHKLDLDTPRARARPAMDARSISRAGGLGGSSSMNAMSMCASGRSTTNLWGGGGLPRLGLERRAAVLTALREQRARRVREHPATGAREKWADRALARQLLRASWRGPRGGGRPARARIPTAPSRTAPRGAGDAAQRVGRFQRRRRLPAPQHEAPQPRNVINGAQVLRVELKGPAPPAGATGPPPEASSSPAQTVR